MWLARKIRRDGGVVSVQPEQRECPGSWRAKILYGRQSFREQRLGPSPPRQVGVAARTLAQRPERSSVTVFRAFVFEPAAIEAHEIAEPPCVGVPGMLHERGEASRQYFGQTPLTMIIERAGQQQSARVVIDAVAMVAIGHRMNRVLQQSGIVAHGQKMVDPHFGRHVVSQNGRDPDAGRLSPELRDSGARFRRPRR